MNYTKWASIFSLHPTDKLYEQQLIEANQKKLLEDLGILKKDMSVHKIHRCKKILPDGLEEDSILVEEEETIKEPTKYNCEIEGYGNIILPKPPDECNIYDIRKGIEEAGYGRFIGDIFQPARKKDIMETFQI